MLPSQLMGKVMPVQWDREPESAPASTNQAVVVVMVGAAARVVTGMPVGQLTVTCTTLPNWAVGVEVPTAMPAVRAVVQSG